MALDLYYMPLSMPCMSVRLLAKTLGIELNLKFVDLFTEEQKKPDFVKMNPQHCIPTLHDDGLYVWESRAILTYLCEKYGNKNSSLFPTDPRQRAVINQRLYFDMGTLWARYGECIYPVIFRQAKEISEEKKSRLKEAFEWLEGFIGDGHVVGDSLTVADFALVCTVAAIQGVGFDISSFTNVTRWLAHCKKNMAGFEEVDGTEKHVQFVRNRLQQAGTSF